MGVVLLPCGQGRSHVESLVFSLNATVPAFLLIVAGWVLRRLGLMDEGFATKANSFVFKVALPLHIFAEMAPVDFAEAWDGSFVAFCLVATALSVLICLAVSWLLFRGKPWRGEFVQAAYRSSATLLGMAFVENIYGTASATSLMIAAAVPVYNVVAVLVLQLTRPDHGPLTRELVGSTLRDVVTNPIILGVAAGLLWSGLNLPLPDIAYSFVSDIGAIATPLGLLSMGALFDFAEVKAVLKPTLVATILKLVGLCALFLPIAVGLGFTGEKLVAIIVMLGSATTMASYVMARNMGHDGALPSAAGSLTTVLSAFTLTFWLWICRSMGLL